MSDKILADRYRLVEQIGVGGMAIVYRAVDQRTGHNVAVKVLKPEFNKDAEFVGRFQREAEAASRMTHHNIVNLLDVGMDGENRYLVMEYVQGKTLKEVIREKGRINPIVAAQITIRILSALQHAHQNGIIHRDIKPQNILVHADGHIKVADFGIARMANSSTLTRSDTVMGSVHYFSPEQASGHAADVTSDIYSVGVVLYEMLTGRVPFEGDSTVAVAMQHLHTRPAPIETIAPEVPLAICHVAMMAMEKNPKYRYQSAWEMALELRKAIDGRTDQMQPRLVEKHLKSPVPMPPPGMPLKQTSTGQVQMPSRRRHRANPGSARAWILTALMAAAVFYGLYVGGVAIYEKVVNSVTVLDYLGMEVSAAQRAATRQGLRAEIVEINHPTISSGMVILQAPEVDSTLRKGDTVVLTVSKGPAALTVPPITGMTVNDGITAASAYGLTLTVVEQVVSTDVQANFIIDQQPKAGEPCQSGDIIRVVVSGGSVFVPNVTNIPLNNAMERLTASNLTMNNALQYVETTDSTLHGMVAEQSPLADTQVVQGTQVVLKVYQVASMMARARVTVELPQSDGLISVRITLVQGESEVTAYQGEYPANASRYPSVELTGQTPGEYTYKVYFGNKFAYQQQVTLE